MFSNFVSSWQMGFLIFNLIENITQLTLNKQFSCPIIIKPQTPFWRMYFYSLAGGRLCFKGKKNTLLQLYQPYLFLFKTTSHYVWCYKTERRCEMSVWSIIGVKPNSKLALQTVTLSELHPWTRRVSLLKTILECDAINNVRLLTGSVL